VITLPASPSDGDIVAVSDKLGNAINYNIEIARNGKNVNGVADGLTVDVDFAFVALRYDGVDNWEIIQVSGPGGSAGGATVSDIIDNTSPTLAASSRRAGLLEANATNWNTAFGWGNHASAGYASSTHTHAAGDITSGTIASARLGSGTADGTKFLRGDNVWAAPAGAGDVSGLAFSPDQVSSTQAFYDPSDSTSLYQSRTGGETLTSEPKRNLLTYTEQFDNASWAKVRASVTANAISAPDGTLTADKIVEDTSSDNSHVVYRGYALVSSTAYTKTVYVKAAGRTQFKIVNIGTYAASFGVLFNLETGTITSGTGGTIEALANDWYKVSVSFSATGTGSEVIYYQLAVDGSVVYTGDGTSGIYLWGAQLEATAYATSYIPTTSTSVTRAADVLTYSLAATDYPLSLFAEFERAGDTGAIEVISTAFASSAHFAALRIDASDRLDAQVRATTDQAIPVVTGAMAAGTVYKGAVRIATDSVQATRGGVLATEDISATMPNAPVSWYLGHFQDGSQPIGYIKRVAIFNSALSDADLQTVTT